MALIRSQLARITASDQFFWAAGIEDTFVTAPWPATGRTLDEYELTQHYDRWEQDLSLMASLGLRVARYGVPWYRINPSPNRWNWTWADRSLDKLLELGLDPIVDLVHYGVPDWIQGAFLHPDFPARMAEYAARLADRFRGRIHAFTPLNEPRITAWYCGRLGWWPPFRKGWRGFVDVLRGISRGITLTSHALRSVDPENVIVHVDPADLYTTDDPSLVAEADRRQQIGFLALDLVSGNVSDDHPLREWLRANRMDDADLDWFRARPVPLDVIGLNLYPMFSNKRLVRTRSGMRIRSLYGTGAVVDSLLLLYWERYRSPLMIAETASRGSIARRRKWLEDSVAAVKRLRTSGTPVVGYTWWPMISHVAWAYRQGDRPITDYLEKMGLWDLSADGTFDRRLTPLVDDYAALVAGGHTAVGSLAASSLQELGSERG